MNQTSIKVDFRIVSLLLVIVIGVMLGFWRPWEEAASKQTVTISGQATVKAEPDEFIFSPVYQKEAPTSTAAIDAVSKSGNEVVAKLQELGVAKKAITTSVSTDEGYPLSGRTKGMVGALYSVKAIVNDSAAAQRVLDYLVTTNPLYGVSPQSTFKDETRQRLENEARAKAVTDARTKAESTASGLDLKLGKVVSISEAQWGGPVPVLLNKGGAEDIVAPSTMTSPTLLTGEQDVSYTIIVVFQLK